MENPDFTPVPILSKDSEADNRQLDEYGELSARQAKIQKITFSPEDIETIISSYQAGKTMLEIAQQFNCSKTTIGKLLKRQGVKIITCRAQAKINPEIVIDMYAEMHTLVEIGQKFGVNPEVISNCLRSHGVSIRSGRWDYEDKKK